MRFLRVVIVSAAMVMAGVAAAQDFMRNKAEVEAMLKGATLTGVYLRTQSRYVLKFGEDGMLVDTSGAGARWWVSDVGQYCREWLTGNLAGNSACMDLVRDGDHISIYSNGNKVAEGELSRRE
ncbi:MAG TPA: hypothetical protein PK725_00875 [Rhodocyclaceae bacterium]|nr:hypothetical protein [Rhodocyclaceae bacterium]HRQ45466.1 hypothetical protein [Rhodocyclaceae bacterium]